MDNIKFKRYTKNNMMGVSSDTYNYCFNNKNGLFMRWGKDMNTSPFISPIGPELCDIEISTICHGINNTPCSFCYKSNTHIGENMSLDTFIKVVNKVNPYKNILQIAIGLGDVNANPDFIPIMKWCRENNIVPNVTINGARLNNKYEGLSYAEWITQLCGAVSVSHYDDDICFNAVKTFTDLGMKYVNIHQILAENNIDACFNMLRKIKEGKDNRLDKLNVIIFLSLKPKGIRNTMTPLKSMDKYKDMITYAMDNHINIGFDSCGAKKFINVIKDTPYKYMEIMAESCEATRFSCYINVKGEYFPCSFVEGTTGWEKGIKVLDIESKDDFFTNLWYNTKLGEIREKMYNCSEDCLFYNI